LVNTRFEYPGIDGDLVSTEGVIVCKIDPSGRFDVDLPDGSKLVGCNPVVCRFFDGDIQVSTPMPQLTETEFLALKIKTVSDYQDFLEECLVEMAGLVYAG
jgi:hypothetical protein